MRDKVRVIAAGKMVTGFHLFRVIALGADLCNAARAMMFALGCIQSRRCNENSCPVGVATQDPSRVVGLDVADKARRVARFHGATVASLRELVGAVGLSSAGAIRPHHVFRQVDGFSYKHFGEIYDYLPQGCLLSEDSVPEGWKADWQASSPDRFC